MLYTKVVDHVELILTGLGFIIWLIRLEGRVNMNEKTTSIAQSDLEALQIKHEALDSKVLEKISQIQQTVARIEGMLESRNEHI
jgi:hypothetical protein